MIWTMIAAAALAAGIIMIVKSDWDSATNTIGTLITIFGSIVLAVLLCVIIYVNATDQYIYDTEMIEYTAICDAYESTDNVTTLTTQITEWNKKVLYCDKWGNSPWTNWLFPQSCTELPYFEFDK